MFIFQLAVIALVGGINLQFELLFGNSTDKRRFHRGSFWRFLIYILGATFYSIVYYDGVLSWFNVVHLIIVGLVVNVTYSFLRVFFKRNFFVDLNTPPKVPSLAIFLGVLFSVHLLGLIVKDQLGFQISPIQHVLDWAEPEAMFGEVTFPVLDVYPYVENGKSLLKLEVLNEHSILVQFDPWQRVPVPGDTLKFTVVKNDSLWITTQQVFSAESYLIINKR